jgi:hypothetical protein
MELFTELFTEPFMELFQLFVRAPLFNLKLA